MEQTFDNQWQTLSQEVITGMAEWRLQHPRATFSEMEKALDERLNRMRAKMLADMALASQVRQWQGKPEGQEPECPECGQTLKQRGEQERQLQTQGGETVQPRRAYGQCPHCGAGFFPPG